MWVSDGQFVMSVLCAPALGPFPLQAVTLTSALQQWFSMYKPITYNNTSLLTEETDSFVNKLDPSKVFKSKNKILIPKRKGLCSLPVARKDPGP